MVSESYSERGRKKTEIVSSPISLSQPLDRDDLQQFVAMTVHNLSVIPAEKKRESGQSGGTHTESQLNGEDSERGRKKTHVSRQSYVSQPLIRDIQQFVAADEYTTRT